jgi:septum formation protein
MDGNHVEEDSIGRVRLVLASASPRRADLLRAAAIEFDVVPAHVDESRQPDEWPDTYVARLAEAKAAAVLDKAAGRPVLAADTIVVCGTDILGKPSGATDARRMLELLSGRTHLVLTGVCLIAPDGSSRHTDVASTAVEFANLSDEDIRWYIASGEPEGKAGAYAIQGLASRFVTAISGSYTNVVGLPVALVCHLCKNAGILVS